MSGQGPEDLRSAPALRASGLVLFRKSTPGETPASRPDPDPVGATRTASRLLCQLCRHEIADPASRRLMLGQLENVFTNPAGQSFRIGCFDDAPGCSPEGEAYLEWTWFPGYTWQISVCARCRTHLGWRYDSGSDSFHGLVLDYLVEV